MAVVTGPAGKLVVPVEVTDAIRPGVVSLPHGWGHTAPGTRLTVAAAQPGVNVNSLLDSSLIEPLSGTAVLNGVPVEVLAG
jgi:anaerobic selenocysteine-containing dehydrogenase